VYVVVGGIMGRVGKAVEVVGVKLGVVGVDAG
jgi:hypothetical protein